MNTSTTHRYVTTLHAVGLVARDATTRKYSFWSAGPIAAPALTSASVRLGETVASARQDCRTGHQSDDPPWPPHYRRIGGSLLLVDRDQGAQFAGDWWMAKSCFKIMFSRAAKHPDAKTALQIWFDAVSAAEGRVSGKCPSPNSAPPVT